MLQFLSVNSQMIELLKQLTPPLVLKLLKQRVFPSPLIYKSYEDALHACKNITYESDDIVKVVVEKNLEFSKKIRAGIVLDISMLRTLIGVGLANSNDRLNVLDFGGGAGYHYQLAKAALGNSMNLTWNIVETAAMAKECKRIADINLNFFCSISEAKRNSGFVDLVFTSSALQYCPEPLAYLKELTEVGAKYIFITRTPLNDSAEAIISTQRSKLSTNGPGSLPDGFIDKNVSYPITFTSKAEFEKVLKKYYDIRFVISEDKAVFRVENHHMDMYGYFCVLR